MNCETCLKHLQMAETGQPGARDRRPRGGMSALQVWQRQLIKIEHNARLLPAPASSPQAFLDVKSSRFNRKRSCRFRPQRRLKRKNRRPCCPCRFGPRSFPRAGDCSGWSARRWLGTAAGGLAAAGILIACGIFLGNLLSNALRKDDEQAKIPQETAASWKRKTRPRTSGRP